MKSPALALALAVLMLFSFASLSSPTSSPDPVIDKVSGPATRPTEVKTATVAATLPPAVVLVDLARPLFGNDGVVQNVTIESKLTNTGAVCITTAAIPQPVVAATDTCLEVCAADARASAMTCSGASTDGEWIDPGETLPHVDAGDICYCARAATGTPTIQAKRVAR